MQRLGGKIQTRQWIAGSLALAELLTATPVSAQPIKYKVAQIFGEVILTPGFSPNPFTVNGVSGGSISAEEIVGTSATATGSCVGFVDRQPDHTLVLEHFFVSLELRIDSNEDTTMVILGPGGIWCNDDAYTHNPRVSGQWLNGVYHIWAGSYQPDAYYPYTLYIYENR